MIGNDLESLAHWPDRSNDRRVRFRKKVYTATEREWLSVHSSANHAEVVLWCAKESVYKAHHRLIPDRRFAPKTLVICPEDGSSVEMGRFTCRKMEVLFHGQWWTKEGLIHCMAWMAGISRDQLHYIIDKQGSELTKLNEQFKDGYGRPWKMSEKVRQAISRSRSPGMIAQLSLKEDWCDYL